MYDIKNYIRELFFFYKLNLYGDKKFIIIFKTIYEKNKYE